MDRAEQQENKLIALRNAMTACRICIESPHQKTPLPHEPRPVAVLSPSARILIAGQAPGLKVHQTGIPFNDASGDRLRDWLNVSRAQFYNPDLFAILPMGFCFPGYDAKGSDLPPRKECAPAWRAKCLTLMPQIDLVLAVGSYAQAWHLQNQGHSMTETVKNWVDEPARNTVPTIVPLPHPSWRNTGWLKKNLWFEQQLLPRLRALVKDRIL